MINKTGMSAASCSINFFWQHRELYFLVSLFSLSAKIQHCRQCQPCNFLQLIQPFILFPDPQDCSYQIKMAALSAHQSSFLLSPLDSDTLHLSSNCVPQNSTKTHFHAAKTLKNMSHTHTPQPFLRPPGAPAPALKQFIEASLHGHSFWNSNCYLIWLQLLSPLRLRLTLVHLCSLRRQRTTQLQSTHCSN